MALILVRHAMPAYEESVRPDLWSLSEVGLAPTRSLDLPPRPYLVASDEPKAYQTLEPLGTVARDPGFREVRREGEPWNGPYRELRRAYVEGADHDGWEPRAAVVKRFDRALSRHTVRGIGRRVVVASHGMAITVWLTATVGLTSPGSFWDHLRFPDVLAVSLDPKGVTPLDVRPVPVSGSW